jgi:uncharacterized membrane protein
MTITERRTNMQNRFKSWALWVSVAGALWTILSAFGLTEKIGITESLFKTVLDAVGVILIGFGIVNNPTDPEHL